MRSFALWLSLGLSSAVALLLPFLASEQQKKEELPHPRTLEEFQKAAKDVVEKRHLPGAGLALVANGELLWCGGIGKADLASNRDITCDTEFRVGSISKAFIALALLKLQEDGKINLYARLQDIAPEIPMKNQWEAAHAVRIVNLLEHTAGFDDMEFSEIYNLRDRYDFPLLEVFKRFREPQDVRWPPGTRFSYSNPGYGIAGYLIEKVSGQPFDQYIRENFLRQLGMQSADFRFTDAVKSLLATGYGGGNPPKPQGYPLIYLRPAGDLKASPGELAKLVQFLLRRGRAEESQLLKPESIMRMESVETTLAAKNGLRLGYGLANYTRLDGEVVTHGHDGGIEGFISSYRYMPEQNWGYVVLLNSTSSGEGLNDLNHLAIGFLSKDFPKSQQPIVPLPAAELKKLTGYYASRAPRDQVLAFLEDLTQGIRIRLIHGQLTRSGVFDKPEPLFPVGKNQFRGEKDPEGSAIFFQDEDGNLVVSDAGDEGIYYRVRSSLLWLYARLALLALCGVLMGSSLPFALIWGLRKLFAGLKDVRHLSVRAVPVVAVLFLMAVPFCFTRLSDARIGTLNLWTFGIFLGTFFFPLLSVIGLALALRVPKEEIHRGVRIHSLLVSSACCVITGFLWSWHMLALRLWAP